MKSYIISVFALTILPVTQLLLVLGANIFGGGIRMEAVDWLLGATLPLYGWFLVLTA